MSARYIVKHQADRDLDAYADYLARAGNVDLALRFLTAAQETIALLARQPGIGWQSRLKHAGLRSLRVFRIAGFERMLVFYRPLADGVEILRVVHASRNLQALFRRRGELS